MVQFSYLLLYGILSQFTLDDKIYNFETCNIENFNEANKARDGCLTRIRGALETVNAREIPTFAPIGFAIKQCGLKTKIDGCVEQANHKIQNCLNSTQKNGLEVWKKIDNEVNKYWCSNNGRVAFTYFRKDSNCWKKDMKKAYEKCLSDHIKFSSPFYDIPLLQKNCGEIDAFQTCLMGNIKESCPADTNDLILPLIQAVKNEICKNIPTTAPTAPTLPLPPRTPLAPKVPKQPTAPKNPQIPQVSGPDDFREFFKNALNSDFNIFGEQ